MPTVLPPEVLLQILRDRSRLEPMSELRLVTSQFYRLATPIYYSDATLTDKLITVFSFKQPESPQEVIPGKVVVHMENFTEDISIKRHRDDPDAGRKCVNFLLSLTRLRSIKSVPTILPYTDANRRL